MIVNHPIKMLFYVIYPAFVIFAFERQPSGDIVPLGKLNPVVLSEFDAAELRTTHGQDRDRLVGYKRCKIGRFIVNCSLSNGSKVDASVVTYRRNDNLGPVAHYGRVKAFVVNSNDGGKLYAVIDPLVCKVETLVDVLERPTHGRLAQEFVQRNYAKNFIQLDADIDFSTVHFVSCSDIIKQTVVIDVPLYGKFVCSVGLSYMHD